MTTFELAYPGWLWLSVVLPAWLLWVKPGPGWGLLVARSDEASGVALGRWTGGALEATPYLLRAAAVGCAIVALAHPQLTRTYQEPVTQGAGIVLAIDLSTSMWAEDMAEGATRLDVAKETTQRFLAGRSDDIGLVSFAGEALTRLPLTDDRYVTSAAVEALEVGILLDGTDIAGAIAAAGGLLRDAPHQAKVLVLVTDGAHNRAGLRPSLAARAAAAHGITIYAVAIGAEGTGVSRSGDMETVLSQVASVTGGRYFRATDVAALDLIFADIERLTEPTEVTIDREETESLGAWPILASLVLLTLGTGLRTSRWGVVP